MVKYLTIILILGTFAQSQQAKDGIIKDISNSIFKRTATKAIQALFPYSAFLESPKIVVNLFEIFTGVDISNDAENAERNKKIMASLDNINVKLDVLSRNMLNFEKEITSKIDTNEQHRDLKNALDRFYNQVAIIDFLYEDYLTMLNESITFSNEKYKAFISTVQSYNEIGVHYPLNQLHSILTKNLATQKNIPMYYADFSDLSRLLMCQSKQSQQRLIFNFYELITVNEMKGALLMTYAYQDLIKANKAGDDLRHFTNLQKERLKKTLRIIEPIAARAPRELWACDPNHHVKGTTYENVGPIFQKFVMFKGDVVEYPHYQRDFDKAMEFQPAWGIYNSQTFLEGRADIVEKNICARNTCASIKRETPKYCYKLLRFDNLCEHEPIEKLTCKTKKGSVGSARDCEPVEEKLKICLAEQNDYRRYKTIDTGNKIYGKNETCTTVVHIAKSRVYTGPDCDYCLCTCEEDSHPQAKTLISMKPVFSNVDENKVITGVQIAHVNGVFQILIEQGQLLGGGFVNRSSMAWEKPQFGETDEVGLGEYVRITWNHRTFLLDDLEGPKGHVLTGIRFEADVNSDIQLAIQTRPFNLTSGKLENIYKSLWSNNPNTTRQRTKLKIAKYEVPTLYHKHEPDSESNQFIQLTTSDMEQDIGQTVVPFFDIQPVVSTYPMPLSGAGLVHMGYGNSAGFLALKIITFDINLLTPKDSDLMLP